MFWLVALITCANLLINDHKSKLEYTNKLKTIHFHKIMELMLCGAKIGIGLDGIGLPGGVRFRALYGSRSGDLRRRPMNEHRSAVLIKK